MSRNEILFIGDTHISVSNASIPHHENMSKFFQDLFDYVDKNGTRTILQLGDLFDVRKHINTWSLNFFRENFIKPVIERDLHVIILLGNHDIYYRESLQVSSVEEVLTPYSEYFTIVKTPIDMVIENETFLLVPWVCKENTEEVQRAIQNSKSKYCAGHFEFNGFELFKGQLAKTHYNHDEYKKFEQVFSGHYHHMSSKDNVLYTGTPYELTWVDCDTPKGMFSLKDSILTFIENPHKLYSAFRLSDHPKIAEDLIHKKFVKITVDTPLEPKQREALLDMVYSMQPHSVKLIESRTVVDDTVEVSHEATTSISELIGEYVETVKLNENIDKEKLNSILLSMFVEASANAS